MASKKLRAIAVRGHDRIEPKDKEGLQACLKWFREHYNRNADTLHKYGTSRNVKAMSADSILPTRNFREGQFEYATEISGQTMAETILTDEGTCYACAIAVQTRRGRARAGGHLEIRWPGVRDHRLQRLGLRDRRPRGHREVPPDLRRVRDGHDLRRDDRSPLPWSASRTGSSPPLTPTDWILRLRQRRGDAGPHREDRQTGGPR